MTKYSEFVIIKLFIILNRQYFQTPKAKHAKVGAATNGSFRAASSSNAPLRLDKTRTLIFLFISIHYIHIITIIIQI